MAWCRRAGRGVYTFRIISLVPYSSPALECRRRVVSSCCVWCSGLTHWWLSSLGLLCYGVSGHIQGEVAPPFALFFKKKIKNTFDQTLVQVSCFKIPCCPFFDQCYVRTTNAPKMSPRGHSPPIQCQSRTPFNPQTQYYHIQSNRVGWQQSLLTCWQLQSCRGLAWLRMHPSSFQTHFSNAFNSLKRCKVTNMSLECS